jgi:hypothetical protein
MGEKARGTTPGARQGRDAKGREAPTDRSARDEVADESPRIERLERYLLVVTPRQPLVDWIGRLGSAGAGTLYEGGFTLEEARAYHRSAYLVPVAEDAHDVESWVEDNFDLIFEQELHAVTSDRRRWPRHRSADVFMAWFTLELLDAPIDLVDAPLVAPSRGSR